MFWDVLTFREYYREYDAPDKNLSTYRRQIVAAIQNRPSTLRHKLSTIVAFLWFLEIYGIYLQRKDVPPYVYVAAVFVGLCVYRWDQNTKKPPHSFVILTPILIAGAIFV